MGSTLIFFPFRPEQQQWQCLPAHHSNNRGAQTFLGSATRESREAGRQRGQRHAQAGLGEIRFGSNLCLRASSLPITSNSVATASAASATRSSRTLTGRWTITASSSPQKALTVWPLFLTSPLASSVPIPAALAVAAGRDRRFANIERPPRLVVVGYDTTRTALSDTCIAPTKTARTGIISYHHRNGPLFDAARV